MSELPGYVSMSPQEYLNNRASGVCSMGAQVDSYRQPGVVGMYNRKPVFVYVNDREQAALEGNDLEALFKMRGYKNTLYTNDNPPLPVVTIP